MRAPGRSEGAGEGDRERAEALAAATSAAGGDSSPQHLGARKTRGSRCDPAPIPVPAPSPPVSSLPCDAAHAKASYNLRVATLQQGAFAAGPGTEERDAKEKGPEIWAVKWVWDAQAGASALALRTRWRWWGEGSSLSTPSFFIPLTVP